MRWRRALGSPVASLLVTGALATPCFAAPAPFAVIVGGQRQRRLDMRPRAPRDHVVLTGLVEAPVAIGSTGEPVVLTDDGILSKVGLDGYSRWSVLLGPSHGAPALDEKDRGYVAGRDRRLYAVDGDGTIRWSRALEGTPFAGAAVSGGRVVVALETGQLAFFATERGVPLFTVLLHRRPASAPIFTSDGLAVVTTEDGRLIAITPQGAATAVPLQAGGPTSALAAGADGEVYAGTASGELVRVEPARGAIAWRRPLGAPVTRSPVLCEDGSVVVVAGSRVESFSADGQPGWRFDTRGTVVGGPLAADDHSIFVTARVGRDRVRGRLFRLAAADGKAVSTPLDVAPAAGLSLSNHTLWFGFDDGTLRRSTVDAAGLAPSPWPKPRGGQRNAGSPLR